MSCCVTRYSSNCYRISRDLVLLADVRSSDYWHNLSVYGGYLLSRSVLRSFDFGPQRRAHFVEDKSPMKWHDCYYSKLGKSAAVHD